MLPLVVLLLAGWYLERQRQFNRDLQDERNHALDQKGIAERNEGEAKKRKREADDQRDEANTQKKLAQDAYRVSQLRLMQMHVARGVRLMEDGDSFAVLPWLVTALKKICAMRRRGKCIAIASARSCGNRRGCARMFFHPAGMVHHVEFSPDGSKLVTTCDDHMARIWDVAANKEVCSLRHIRTTNLPTMFSPDGHQVLTISLDRKVHVRDAATGKDIRTLAVQGASGACFSPDGQRLLVDAGRGVRLGCADGPSGFSAVGGGRSDPGCVFQP